MEQEVKQENTQETEQQQEVDTTEKNVNSGITEAEIQKRIDASVKNRLNREKESQRLVQESWEAEKMEMQEELEYLRKQVQLTIDATSAELDDDVRSLLTKLSIREQIEFVNKKKSDMSNKKQTIQQIPNFGKKNNDNQKVVDHPPIDRIF